MSITAHCLVKNEENFIWFAIMSALPFVDRILVWDTQSHDKTIEIIKSIKSPKIEFSQKGQQDRKGIAQLRQEMIDKTSSEWIMILDGDEIWWHEALLDVKSKLENGVIDAVISPVYMLVGDIFHYQDEKAGRYNIAGREGHYNIRFIRNMKGLRIEGEYPDEAYVTPEGMKVQNLPKDKLYFSEHKYLHASHLRRTSLANKKQKLEIGNKFPVDFYYPEVLFLPRPENILSPWQLQSGGPLLKSQILTPLKKLKRMLYV